MPFIKAKGMKQSLQKGKEKKKDLFILEVGKLVVVTVENQIGPITKEKC